MSKYFKFIAVLLVMVALAGLTPTDSSAAPGVRQVAMGWHAQSGSGLVGEKAVAQIVRREEGISFSIRARNLIRGHTYTIWFIAITNPDACATSPCGAPDIIQNPATNTQVSGAGGAVASASGTLGFGGQIRAGMIPDGWFAGKGLEQPLTAEIHFVINDHGPVIPGLAAEMTSTYRAGCTTASLPAIFPATA